MPKYIDARLKMAVFAPMGPARCNCCGLQQFKHYLNIPPIEDDELVVVYDCAARREMNDIINYLREAVRVVTCSCQNV